MVNSSKFWNEELSEGFYDLIFKEGSLKNRGFKFGWHNLTFLKLSKLVNKNKTHLDFACGPGTFIGNYLEANSIGVDISQKQINYAIKEYGNNSEFMTLASFNYEKYRNNFDIITVVGLLEFINLSETEELLDNLYKICKPGGKVIFTTPNYTTTFKTLQYVANIIFPVSYEGQTISKYNHKSINTLFRISKFENYSFKKILNFGVFFSFISFSLAYFLEEKISKLSGNRLGNLLLVEFIKTN